MKFDLPKTAAVFLGLIAVGIGGIASAGFMEVNTVLMMVLPSTLVFGLICVGIGVKHGEYRATQ